MSTRELFLKSIPYIITITIITVISLLIRYPLNGNLVCESKKIPGTLTTQITYKVSFKMRKIDKIQVKQVITSDDMKKIIDYHAILQNETEGESKNIKLTDNKIVYNIDIDYKKDVEENKTKKISVEKLRKNYERIGAVCKYKK